MMNKPRISIVAAIGKNREIGKDNDLLWNIPEDRKRFREITWGHPVIWGRKTFESVLTYIHKAPPGRTNIVVTRNRDDFLHRHPELDSGSPKLIIVDSLEEALQKAKPSEGADEIFIGGGGQLWEQSMTQIDRLYLTIVQGDYTADTFFPDYSDFKKIISEENHESGEYTYKFLVLEKNQ